MTLEELHKDMKDFEIRREMWERINRWEAAAFQGVIETIEEERERAEKEYDDVNYQGIVEDIEIRIKVAKEQTYKIIGEYRNA